MKNILKKLFGAKKEFTSQKVNNKLVQKTEEELKREIEKLQINGYPLPKKMVKRITNDNWKVPINKKHLENLIIQNCPFEKEVRFLKQMINDFSLFSLGLMKSESEHLVKWLHPKWEKDRVILLGKKDDKIYPGNIEHDKVILFADFGHGSDTCFALDFRENENSPIVILEYWGENPQTDNRWKKIANSFEDFEQIVWKEN